MKLEHEFTVAAPIDETWNALLDVQRVATCLPGATVRPAAQEGAYDGRMKLKLGPMTAEYKGTLRMEEIDEASRSAVMHIQAKELKGQGGAAARMESRLAPEDDGRTRVVVGTDLEVSGRIAQLGRGMMENVADRLLGDFAQRLERELAAGRDGEPTAATGMAAVASEPPPRQTTGPAALSTPEAGAASPTSSQAGPGLDDTVSAADGDTLDLGSAAFHFLTGRKRAVALGTTATATVLLVMARRRRRAALVLSFRSGWGGRRAELRVVL